MEATQTTPVKVEAKMPAGWWSITNCKGTLDGVTKYIATREDVPAMWRAMLSWEIEKLSKRGFNFVELDAHCHIDIALIINLTIKPIKANI